MTSEPKVTIAIPTFNRSGMLAVSLASALNQDWPDLRVVVLDNASTDNTREVVRSFNDARLVYLRHDRNIGLFRNWQCALKVNRSPYVCILQDDDVMQRDFVSRSLQALEAESAAAFSCTGVRFVDIDGAPLHSQVTPHITAGPIRGLDLLHRIVAGDNWVIHASSVMLRASALGSVGYFDVAHSKLAIEFNLYFRLAATFDFVFLADELMHVRLHEGQDHRVSARGTGPLAMVSERIDAIAWLMKSSRAENREYRDWLAERLLVLGMARSELTAQLVPDLNLGWQERVEILQEEAGAVIPRGERVVLVDENHFGPALFPGIDVVPFVECDGQYWGPPADDASGIGELERLRAAGACYVLVCWPAFWWLDYYSGLREHLDARYRRLFGNSRLVVFDLRVAALGEPGEGVRKRTEAVVSDER